MMRVLIDNDSKTMERSQRHKGIIASQQVILTNFDEFRVLLGGGGREKRRIKEGTERGKGGGTGKRLRSLLN
jgi:hypothetical protein